MVGDPIAAYERAAIDGGTDTAFFSRASAAEPKKATIAELIDAQKTLPEVLTVLRPGFGDESGGQRQCGRSSLGNCGAVIVSSGRTWR